jgi:hypothetical protein
MAIAKGIGGGFPLGASDVARRGAGMTVGTHGTTFGGNPLAASIGNAVLDAVLAPGFIEHVALMGVTLKQSLARLKDRHGEIIWRSAAKVSCRASPYVSRSTISLPPRGPRNPRHSGGRECRAAAAAADHRQGGDFRSRRAFRRRLPTDRSGKPETSSAKHSGTAG